MARSQQQRRVRFEGMDDMDLRAQAAAAARRKEDIRHFLWFLQAGDPNELRRQISEESSYVMAQVTLMFDDYVFDDLDTADAKLDAFLRVVSTLTLPNGTRALHEHQLQCLGAILDRWVLLAKYDPNLDRFIQHLRHDEAVEDHMAAVFGEDRARELAQEFKADEGVSASLISTPLKEDLDILKAHMKAQGAYTDDDRSSDAKTKRAYWSDEDNVEEEFHF